MKPNDVVLASDLLKINYLDKALLSNHWCRVDDTHIRFLGTMAKCSPSMSIFSDNIIAKRDAQIVANFYLGIQENVINSTFNGSTSVYLDGNTNFENILVLSSGETTGSDGILETKKGLRYVPGYELGLFVAAMFDKPITDGHARIGFMDDDNGFWIGYQEVDDNIEFGVAIRKDGVDTFVKQSDFNGDTLDGHGCRNFVLNPSQGNIYRIRVGYLGFAPPTFEIMMPNSEFIIMHQFNQLNTTTETHISNTSLPVRAEVSNGTGTDNVKVKSSAFNAYLTDGDSLKANTRDFSLGINDTLSTTVSYDRVPIISMRNSGQFQGTLCPSVRDHRIDALLNYFDLYVSGQNKSIRVELLSIDEDDVTNTPTWQKVSSDSILDYSTNITFDDSNAEVLYTSILKKTEDKICKDLELSNIRIHPKKILVFTITSVSTSDLEWDFANGWSELF